MLRKMNMMAAFAGAALMASAAGAVTFTASPGAPDPGPGAGETVLVNFNGDLPDGYSLSGDFALRTGTMQGTAAAPAGDATRYLYTSSALGGGQATLSTLDLQSISFYWGSIDDYNDVDVLGAGGITLLSLNGANIPPADGDQSDQLTNRRVFFRAGVGETITGLRFRSTGIAFEVDDVAGSFSNGNPLPVVPEPATWAMMIAGFGLVGVASRRRRKVTSVTA